jgi:hypothetical protein
LTPAPETVLCFQVFHLNSVKRKISRDFNDDHSNGLSGALVDFTFAETFVETPLPHPADRDECASWRSISLGEPGFELNRI